MSHSEKGPEDITSHTATTRDTAQLDWHELRAESLKAGGFGARRTELWPPLLHVHQHSHLRSDTKPSSESSLEHRDERQIKLDTERSFVLYPVDNTAERKDELQASLHDLIVSVFRKRPRLNYFQGYHDIVTVLFLTLPPEMQFDCAEKLSLHRVRDSMGSGLEPVLGLLRVMTRLIRLADPSLASLLEQISTLPYYSLSNLLTLFAHDMPSLPLIQHVFDYLLCRPPIAIVYLATALILCRKSEIEILEEEGEEGMVHSLLSGLPNIYDDETVQRTDNDNAKESSDSSLQRSEVVEAVPEEDLLEDRSEDETEDETVVASSDDTEPAPSDSTLPDEDASIGTPSPKRCPDPTLPPPLATSPFPEAVKPADENKPPSEHGSLKDDSDAEPTDLADDDAPPRPPRRPKIALSTLLVAADELYAKYPPNHPDISLTSIMGPQSVVFTWSESRAEMPSDDEAERMVDKPELIVRPYVDPDLVKQEHDSSEKSGRRRGRHPKSRGRFGHMQRRTVVAGAVVAVGVAVAVYGLKSRSANGGLFAKDGFGTAKEWQRAGGWLGGALMSAGERILHYGA